MNFSVLIKVNLNMQMFIHTEHDLSWFRFQCFFLLFVAAEWTTVAWGWLLGFRAKRFYKRRSLQILLCLMLVKIPLITFHVRNRRKDFLNLWPVARSPKWRYPLDSKFYWTLYTLLYKPLKFEWNILNCLEHVSAQ